MFYYRNPDETYRKAVRNFELMPNVENYSRLVMLARRNNQPEPHPPLARWRDIIDYWESDSWDTVIECGLSSKTDGSDPSEITRNEYLILMDKGYYGKPIEPEHAEMLSHDKSYEITDYAVHYNGIDGSLTKHFDSLIAAADYVNDRLAGRVDTRISGDSFSTDYGIYTLHGFTFNDMEGLALSTSNIIDELVYNLNGNYWDLPEPITDYEHYDAY